MEEAVLIQRFDSISNRKFRATLQTWEIVKVNCTVKSYWEIQRNKNGAIEFRMVNQIGTHFG